MGTGLPAVMAKSRFAESPHVPCILSPLASLSHRRRLYQVEIAVIVQLIMFID